MNKGEVKEITSFNGRNLQPSGFNISEVGLKVSKEAEANELTEIYCILNDTESRYPFLG